VLYRNSAKNALRNHYGQSCEGEDLQPATAFSFPGPQAKNDGQETNEFGDHAMAMFELHTTYHMGHLVDGSESGGPVGDGQAGVVAGDQSSGNDEKESCAGREHGETVMGAVERYSQRFQKVNPHQ
jgi:hypothetical protein